jgi:hypothetical protein
MYHELRKRALVGSHPRDRWDECRQPLELSAFRSGERNGIVRQRDRRGRNSDQVVACPNLGIGIDVRPAGSGVGVAGRADADGQGPAMMPK